MATNTNSKPKKDIKTETVDASQSEKSPVTSQSNKNETKTEASKSSRPVLRPMEAESSKPKSPSKPPKSPNKLIFIAIAVVVLLLGSASGYALAVMQSGSSPGATTNPLSKDRNLKREVQEDQITKGTKVGIADESTFSDSAEGTVQKGGLEGEGSHHLIRPGGEDQTLYMTSSVIDLDQFIDRKVKVWGETLGAQKAGWLMDVGKLEVLE